MALARVRHQDRLDGASNFGVWKIRFLLILEEHGLKEFATTHIVGPTSPIMLHEYWKDDAMARCIILDGVKDQIVRHLAKDNTTKKM